jgi:hypothetical protein
MIVRNKIWEEIKEADVFYRCAIEYASVQRQFFFFYKVAIPVLAALCALFAKLEMPSFTFWSAILIFVSSILKTFCTQIILPDKIIEQLDKLGVDFESYRVKDEKLMEELDNDKITDEDAIKELNKHNSDYCKKKSELNKLVLWIPFWIKKRLRMSSEEYLLRVHHNQYK